jgi:hypothetical protein
MSRDEKQILETVLERTGLAATIATDEDGAASATLDGVTVDAPEGWVRLATTIARPKIDVVARANLGLVHLQSGLAHVHFDAPKGVVRIVASLPAVTDAPSGAAVLGTLEHLAAVRNKILTGEGDIRADSVPMPATTSDVPTLADVARVTGKALALVPDKASFVGGLREPRSGTECAIRLHTALPGVFACDAWLLPPKRTEPDAALFDRLDELNASLVAGVMFLVPGESFVVYRWACPYKWLALDQLEAPALAYTALSAFMRWRASAA